MSAMTGSNWEMLAGDPTQLALKLSFLRNPHGADDKAVPEEAASWGSFELWVGGENLCAHLEQGEVLSASHWYILPLLEWFTVNWDVLFHEERLALKNAGTSAADNMARTKSPPLTLKEFDEFSWMDEWASWWDRHSFRSRREGGLFPDVYFRRYRDTLEVSTGAENLVGIPDDFTFLAPNRRYEVNPRDAASAIFSVIQAASEELARRVAGQSERIDRLVNAVNSLAGPDRKLKRYALLAGCGDDVESYQRITTLVDGVFDAVPQTVKERITGSNRDTDLVVSGSAYAQLVYGAYSPELQDDDIRLIAGTLLENYTDDASAWLNKLSLPLDLAEVKDLSPGEQGSWLGEKSCELLLADIDEATWIDIHGVLDSLGVGKGQLPLSDRSIRAISVFGPTQRPKVLSNPSFRWGNTSEIERFTMAHELCHLLIDRDHADELAVASGPWAPMAIEQRANAFAASFLMPTWLLRGVIASAGADVREFDTITQIATSLRVSVTTTIDRLLNLGELDPAERYSLKAQWASNRYRDRE